MSADRVVVALFDGLTPEEFVKDNPAWTSTFKFTPAWYPPDGFTVHKLVDMHGSEIYIGVIAPAPENYWYAYEVSCSTAGDGRHLPAFCPNKPTLRKTKQEAAADLWRLKRMDQGT